MIFPRRSARSRIPEAAFAVKQYFGCAVVTKTCDNEDSTASLGDSEPLSVKNPPASPIPHVCQRPDEGGEVPSGVRAEDSRYVFPNEVSWSDTFNQFKIREHNSSAGVLETASAAGCAEGLARRSAGHNVN